MHMGVEKGEATDKKQVWPTDFHVCTLDEGFDYIEHGMQQQKSSHKLFLEFFGQKIVPTTFKNNQRWYTKKVDETLKAMYIDYRETDEGLCPAFTKACRDKRSGIVHEGASEGDDDAMSTSSLKSLCLDKYGWLPGNLSATPDSSAPPPPPSSKCLWTCQFCEEELPDELSPGLEHLLETLMSPSFSCAAPTLENPNVWRHRGPKGFKILMEFCGGHVRQDKVLTIAQGHGWPMPDDIDADMLTSRVASLSNELARVVQAPNTNVLF
ncbi:hypothetical protein K439DRAFT_1613587 [Ramaria rubella]|nr:hypothetical protein K439DRAFT_1613587 [Ramaria rubella]